MFLSLFEGESAKPYKPQVICNVKNCEDRVLIACSWLPRSLGDLGQTPGKSWEPQNREAAVDIDPRGLQQTESGQVATSTLLRQDMEKMEEKQKGKIPTRILRFGDQN